MWILVWIRHTALGLIPHSVFDFGFKPNLLKLNATCGLRSKWISTCGNKANDFGNSPNDNGNGPKHEINSVELDLM